MGPFDPELRHTDPGKAVTVNDVVIFVVGLGVTSVAVLSAFTALIASDYPDGPGR